MQHRKYLNTFFAFIASCIFLFSIAEILVRKIENVYGYKNDQIEKKESAFNTLILGSSHTFFGINPEHISRPAFNAANVSQDLKYDLFILKKSLNTLKNVEFVIVPLSIFSLYSELESGTESWRKYNYIHWFGYRELSARDFFDLRTYSEIASSPNKSGLVRRAFDNYVLGTYKPTWSKQGWGTEYAASASESTLVETGKSAAMRHQKNQEKNTLSIERLKNIAEICTEKNIKLLIITTPAHSAYRDNLDSDRLTTMTSTALNISDKNKNIRYINYLADERFSNSDFHDADHLSHKGAEKFTKLINRELSNWDSYTR